MGAILVLESLWHRKIHAYDRFSLLVLNAPTTNGVLRVVDALPITEYLTLAVAQTGPINSSTAESGPSGPTEAWSGMSSGLAHPI